MNKEQIIEHILSSPKNTNKAVLQTALSSLAESDDEVSKLVLFTIGETITGEAGTEAKVENIGTIEKPILQFTIPRGLIGEKGGKGERGPQGIQGIQGIQGPIGPQGKPGKDGTSIEEYIEKIIYNSETNQLEIYHATTNEVIVETINLATGTSNLELGTTEGTAFEGSAGAQLQQDLATLQEQVTTHQEEYNTLKNDGSAAIEDLRALEEKVAELESSDGTTVEVPSISVNGTVVEPDENNNINIEIPEMPEIPEVDLTGLIAKEGEQEVSSDFTLKTITTSEEGTESVYAAIGLTETGVKMTGVQVSIEDLATDNATVVVEGSLGANQVIGGVWNDYAELREVYSQDCSQAMPGRVMTECWEEEDTIRLTMNRLEPIPMVITDTFGFNIGKKTENSKPIAVAGRVLVYPYEDRDSYQLGDVVCAGPGGTCSKMTSDEIMRYPDRILGYVSGVPSYTNWENDIPVNGRIWIKLR